MLSFIDNPLQASTCYIDRLALRAPKFRAVSCWKESLRNDQSTGATLRRIRPQANSDDHLRTSYDPKDRAPQTQQAGTGNGQDIVAS